MEIEKHFCRNCKKEHIRKVYENKSEAISDRFIELAFEDLWESLKEKSKGMPLKDFCKEIVFASVYNFHKHIKKFKINKENIKSEKDFVDSNKSENKNG